MCVYVCVCARVCASVRACVRACVWVDGWVGACVRACGWMGGWVRACVRACVRVRLDLSFYLVDFNRTGLIFFVFFLCDGGSKIRFLVGPMRFCVISNFRFSQNLFFLLLMIGSRYLNRIGIIRKLIKILIFSKKN